MTIRPWKLSNMIFKITHGRPVCMDEVAEALAEYLASLRGQTPRPIDHEVDYIDH